MRWLALISVVLVAGCSGQAAPTSTPVSSPSPSSISSTAPSSPPTVAPSAASVASKPLPSGPCIDTGDLADHADVVLEVLQGLVADLKIPNAAQARTDAGTAMCFRTAASVLTTAIPKFPGGESLVTQAQSDVTTGLTVAGTFGCPS
jgi:hypothetical protein